jgi:signal transduction histidine kinase
MSDSLDGKASWKALWGAHPGVFGGLLLLLAGTLLLPLASERQPLAKALDYVSVFSLTFWTAGLAWRRARHEGPSAFGLLGLGAALGGLRYIPTLLQLPHAAVTGPAFSILGLLALGTGFLIWPQRVRMPRDQIRTILDGFALALSMFTVAWVTMGSVGTVGPLSRGLMLVYMLQISVCLGLLALWLLQETRLALPEQAKAKRFVRRALITLLLYSILVALLRATGHYQKSYLGHASEALHQVANLFLALAALSPSLAPASVPTLRQPSPLRALIPSLVALGVLLLIAVQVFRPGVVPSKPLLGLGLGLMFTLIIRHGLLILDLERLSHGLEARVEARTRELETHHREALNNVRIRMMAGLAAGLVHDLNNLLCTFRLRLGFLQETCSPQQQEDIGVLQDVSERAIAMTRRILSSSQPQDLSPAAFSLTDWMDSRAGLLKAIMLEGQHLELQVEPGLQVFADPQSLDQILQNLVSNARDAIGPKGTLRILAAAQSGIARMEVRDDGPGISPDQMVQVFEPFFSTKPSGTGLGLATVRNLILQNHGTIRVESVVGLGTTFIIELPVPN